ncbi:MAG: hypothetical protein Q8891_06530 [Bacteroidota bacterium]|nr:hypothetical protein [Bacteroidota bacterium]
MNLRYVLAIISIIYGTEAGMAQANPANSSFSFEGKYFAGNGDTNYLALLDSAYSLLEPNAEMENLSMLYKQDWDGFVEGPTWNAWWIQNSFGPTYTMLPFMDKAYQTFIYNSQDMWFKMQGNGVRKDNNGYVGPKGVLCDAATPDGVYYRQGDGKVDKHDWCFGFTTAGILLESELMLIRRDKKEIDHYLPMLEESADFVDSRRDTIKNMFLVGPAANLLAPSYAGTGKLLPDGSYGKAYLAEISVNYIAALNRLIELEKIMGRKDKIKLYSHRLDLVKKGLQSFTTPEGYFIRSIDPDGTKHGVFGAPKHGYFESTPNHDAMAFRVVDDRKAKKIYNIIKSIPKLRPYKLIIPNYPAYDDMYEYDGIFKNGIWVNGGEWTTCEARMQLGYYRVGAYQDAKAAFEKILHMAISFRMDNPLSDFGNRPYQPNLPINVVYDNWGVPGGFLRGLFEYIYSAEGLRLYPHIPPGITTLQQKFPIYFGRKKIYIAINGSGNISSVTVNGKPTKDFTKKSIFLPLDAKVGIIHVSIGLGGSPTKESVINEDQQDNLKPVISMDNDYWNIDMLRDVAHATSKTTVAVLNNIKKMSRFYSKLVENNLQETYEAKHAALILEVVKTIFERRKLKKQKKIELLPEKSQVAADNLYISTVNNLTSGLIQLLEKEKSSSNKEERKIYLIWKSI